MRNYNKKNNFLKSIYLLAVFALTCNISVIAQTLTINTTDHKQTITMMGGDMERSGSNLQRAINKEEIIDWFIKDMPLNTWRVAYDKKQELTEGQKNWNFYADSLATMKMIKDINPNIKFFASMKSDYHGYSEDNHNNLPTFIYDYAVDNNGAVSGNRSFNILKYARFLADYLEYMSDQNVPISYLTTAKEWVQVVTPTRAKSIIENLQKELASRGIAMPLMIEAGTWSLSQGINTANAYVANGTNSYMHGFSSHNLWSGETKTWSQFVNAASSAGKPAFNDESGHGGGGLVAPGKEVDIQRTIASYSEKANMYRAGITGELIFEVWPRGVSEVKPDGSYYAKPVFFDGNIPGHRMRSYYIMKMFTSHILSHLYIPTSISSAPGIYTMAFRKDNKMVLWVINEHTTAYPSLSINLDNSNINGSIVNTYWTDNNSITGVKTNYSASGRSFSPHIEGSSINSFVFNVEDHSCPGDTLTPFYQKNSGAWVKDKNISLDQGDDVRIGPWPATNSAWTWTGPNQFSALTREIDFTNVSASHSGDYVGTYTNANGCTSTLTYSLSVTSYANIVHMRKGNASEFAIDGGHGGADRQNLYLWSQNSNNENQQWIETDQGNGYYSYQKQGTSFCIDGNNGGSNGLNVMLWTCSTNNQNQHWKKINVGENKYRLEKRNNPEYSLDGGGNGANGQNIYLWRSDNSNKNQHWLLE